MNASRPQATAGTAAQTKENKRKQTKDNERKIVFISFCLLFRIEAFQWVTADSNKNSSPVLHCGGDATCSSSSSPSARHALARPRPAIRAEEIDIAYILNYGR